MKGKRESLDRISALPQDTIEKILTHMPLRDALRTSILSRKWRYCWTSIPKLVFDEDALLESRRYDELGECKFVKAIFQVLLLRRAPISEFSLFVHREIFSEIDQMILHLSRSNDIKKFTIGISGLYLNYYLLPCSLFSLQRLEHLDLSFCKFQDSLMNKGFSTLKSLCFYNVSFTNEMLQGFLNNCPLLEEFTWTASDQIELTECELVELFKCLPSVQVLRISKLGIKGMAAGGMPHKFPISLPNLRIFFLSVCFLDLSSVLCVINNSPNLEKIEIQMCWNHDGWCLKQTFNNVLDPQDYSGLTLDHLKELEITNFHNHPLEMEFVKLIMAKSPVLKKARIELSHDVSVDEEVKMLHDLVHIPFQGPSPTASFTIERPKE